MMATIQYKSKNKEMMKFHLLERAVVPAVLSKLVGALQLSPPLLPAESHDPTSATDHFVEEPRTTRVACGTLVDGVVEEARGFCKAEEVCVDVWCTVVG